MCEILSCSLETCAEILSLQSLKEYLTSPIDCVFVLDYTRFKNTAELPVDWLKNGIETIPADMRGKIHAMYILNANSLTLRFFRKFFLISPGMYHFQNTGMKIDIIHYGQNRIWLERFMPCHRWRNCSSILAMWRAYGRVGVARAHLIHESTYLMIYNTGLLEAESPRVFRNVYQRYVHHKESAVTLEIRESHLRIISVSRKSDGFNGTNS